MGRVYSTDKGRHCPTCGQPITDCNCGTDQVATGDGIVRLQRQVKGRNGKPVTIITGVPLAGKELKALAKDIKNRCGVGGSIEDGNILIQGDKRDRIREVLEAKGYRVKLSGG